MGRLWGGGQASREQGGRFLLAPSGNQAVPSGSRLRLRSVCLGKCGQSRRRYSVVVGPIYEITVAWQPGTAVMYGPATLLGGKGSR